MFKLKFGIIWTAFTTVVFAMCIFIPGEQRGRADLDLPLTLFFLLFEAIGIFVIYSGAKTVIADKKTDKYGNMVYGKILNISPTGSYENGNAEYQAEIIAYIPEENRARTFKEIIGFDFNKYQVGSYLLLKHFEDDVNILLEVKKDKVPIKTLEAIGDDSSNTIYSFESDNSWDSNLSTNNYSKAPQRNISQTPQKSYNQQYINASSDVFNHPAYQFITTNANKIKGIYCIISGIIWNLLILGIFYFPKFLPDTGNTTYSVNGVTVTKDEFYSIMPLLPFLIVGLIIIIIGIVTLTKKDDKN